MKKVLVVLLVFIMSLFTLACEKDQNNTYEYKTYEFKTFSIEMESELVTKTYDEEFDKYGYLLSCPTYEFYRGDKLILTIQIGGIGGDLIGNTFDLGFGTLINDGKTAYIIIDDDTINWFEYVLIMNSDEMSSDELNKIAKTIKPVRVK